MANGFENADQISHDHIIWPFSSTQKENLAIVVETSCFEILIHGFHV